MKTSTTFGSSEHTISTRLAIEQGFKYADEPPKPEHCKYCGKELLYYGLKSPFEPKTVLMWFKLPQKCDCEKAVQFWEKKAAVEKAEKQEQNRLKENKRLQDRINKILRASGMKTRFLSRTFDNFKVDELNESAYKVAKRYTQDFDSMLPVKDSIAGFYLPPKNIKNGLMISGTYGIGKTHLAVAIANELIKKAVPVICMTMIDLLAGIKQSFDVCQEISEFEIMRVYEQVPLLIIDDIGSEQPSQWASSKIFAIVNARYEAYMPTIVTTNYTGDELIRAMTPSNAPDSGNAQKTVDRLKEMCIGIEMTGQSKRAAR